MLRGVKIGGCAQPSFVFPFSFCPATAKRRLKPDDLQSVACSFTEQIRQQRPLQYVCKSNVTAQFRRWDNYEGRAQDTWKNIRTTKSKVDNKQFCFAFNCGFLGPQLGLGPNEASTPVCAALLFCETSIWFLPAWNHKCHAHDIYALTSRRLQHTRPSSLA